MSPRRKNVRQVNTSTVRFCERLGPEKMVSLIVLTTDSINVNCVPKPRVDNIVKNRMDQNREIGKRVTASG